MAPPPLLKDPEVVKLYKWAQLLCDKGAYNKALETFGDLISAHRENSKSWVFRSDQGQIYLELAQQAHESDMEVVYLLGALGCFSQDVVLSGSCARVLYRLAQVLGSVLYYRKCRDKAKDGLVVPNPDFSDPVNQEAILPILKGSDKKGLAKIIKEAEYMIAVSKTTSIRKCDPEVCGSTKTPNPRDDTVRGLRSYWMGLDVNVKRDFMKVSIAKLRSFVEGVHTTNGRDAFEQALASARKNGKWTFWMCRTSCLKKSSKCLENFSSAEECRTHLEEDHAADCRPFSEKDMVKRIGKTWAHKIQVGVWEPVDAVAAVEMIKNQLPHVKAFTSKSKKKGWSKEWPLAADEERSNLLKEIKLILVSLCDQQVLSCSIRDWVMRFPVKHLRELEVSEESLIDSCLLETPQSICFLERHDLNQIRDFLKNIKCERHDGADLVGRAVNNLLDRTGIKETIDFDPQFSLLLLDKRLLKRNNAPFDYDGKFSLIHDPNDHYAKAHAQGDDIISWLVDYASVYKRFPKPIREHNLDVWVAVLGAVQFTCRALKTKHAKKKQFLDYEAALTVVENLCMSEDERRRIVQEDQWNSYASLLYDRSEERVPENSLTTKFFFCAVRDVLHEASHPTFNIPDLEDCLDLIRERKSLSDDLVSKSIKLLKSVVTQKDLLMDAKILVIDNSRIRFLNNLTRLSAFDYRSYMLQLLKPFLLSEILNMEYKEKSEAAEADLLFQEEKMLQAQKKKKTKSNKITSTSMSSPLTPLDKTVEHEPSVNLEPEEGSMEPEESSMEPGEGSTAQQISSTSMSSPLTPLDKTVEHEPSVNLEPEEGSMEPEESSMEPEESSMEPGEGSMAQQISSTSMSSPLTPLDKTVEHEPSVNLEPEEGSMEPEESSMEPGEGSMERGEGSMERGEGSMEPEDTLASERGRLEISSNTDIQVEDMENMPGEDSLWGHLDSALGGSVARYSSALDMTLKALMNIGVLKEDLKHNKQPLEEQVPCALQNLFTAVVSGEIKTEGVYSYILSDLLASLEEVNSMPSDAAEVLVTILEFWHCWRNSERESLVTRLFTLEENERMSCRKCRREPNYPEQSSYGIVMAADSIRYLKCAFGNRKFVDILKVMRMEHKMLCDIKSGGCGKSNFFHHIISRCPPIFTIVLEWEKSESETEISETTKALEWEIDISRLYEGLEPNTNYRLVSMVGYGEGEEEEQICIAYEKNRWVNLRRESLAGEVVGNWKNVVRFCGERKVRPEILFYEAARSVMA